MDNGILKRGSSYPATNVYTLHVAHTQYIPFSGPLATVMWGLCGAAAVCIRDSIKSVIFLSLVGY